MRRLQTSVRGITEVVIQGYIKREQVEGEAGVWTTSLEAFSKAGGGGGNAHNLDSQKRDVCEMPARYREQSVIDAIRGIREYHYRSRGSKATKIPSQTIWVRGAPVLSAMRQLSAIRLPCLHVSSRPKGSHNKHKVACTRVVVNTEEPRAAALRYGPHVPDKSVHIECRALPLARSPCPAKTVPSLPLPSAGHGWLTQQPRGTTTRIVQDAACRSGFARVRRTLRPTTVAGRKGSHLSPGERDGGRSLRQTR